MAILNPATRPLSLCCVGPLSPYRGCHSIVNNTHHFDSDISWPSSSLVNPSPSFISSSGPSLRPRPPIDYIYPDPPLPPPLNPGIPFAFCPLPLRHLTLPFLASANLSHRHRHSTTLQSSIRGLHPQHTLLTGPSTAHNELASGPCSTSQMTESRYVVLRSDHRLSLERSSFSWTSYRRLDPQSWWRESHRPYPST